MLIAREIAYDRVELTRFEILRTPPAARKWTPPCPGTIRSRRPCTAAGRRRPTETRNGTVYRSATTDKLTYRWAYGRALYTAWRRDAGDGDSGTAVNADGVRAGECAAGGLARPRDVTRNAR